ncbi:MAG: hypothetical protein INR62_08760, partial [Rhodospirillales bacterium]|nr:hypothetical protein [Acetobacter sp.]
MYEIQLAVAGLKETLLSSMVMADRQLDFFDFASNPEPTAPHKYDRDFFDPVRIDGRAPLAAV